MKRVTALKILNPVVGILLVSQILTGMLHGAMPFPVFAVVHKAAGIVFGAVAAVHIALNWNWVVMTYFRKSR